MGMPSEKPTLHSGWTGRKCKRCSGTGEINTEHSYSACPDCAGTGDEFGIIVSTDEDDNF